MIILDVEFIGCMGSHLPLSFTGEESGSENDDYEGSDENELRQVSSWERLEKENGMLHG